VASAAMRFAKLDSGSPTSASAAGLIRSNTQSGESVVLRNDKFEASHALSNTPLSDPVRYRPPPPSSGVQGR
jgi:hypothetical protein